MAIKKVSQQVIKEDIWHEVGTAGEPAFANSWVNYSTAYNSCAFMKDALGFVHLKGLMKSGTVGLAAFTLPAGYRPIKGNIFASNGAGAYASVYVNTTGTVVPTVGNNGFIAIDGMTFRAEL